MKKFFLLLLGLAFLFTSLRVSGDEVRIPKYGSDGEYVRYLNTDEYVTLPSTFKFKEKEMRAVWVSVFAGNISSYSTETKFKTEMTEMLDMLEYYNFNTLIFHIRTHNNALYKSDLNPLASFWSKVDFDEFDPLAWLIDETHKRGMEFHAWMNPYRIQNGSKTYKAEDYPKYNAANNPDNVLKGVSDGTTKVILDPGREEVKQFLVNTCMEVVNRYEVDAIHFDDYFYIPNAEDDKTYAENNPNGLSLAEWRRSNVDDFIRRLSISIRNHNKKSGRYVQLGIAPSGVYKDGDGKVIYDENGTAITTGSLTRVGGHYGNSLYCDTKKWVDNEWIDYIMPQCYHDFKKTISSFAAKVDWWNAVVKYKKVNLYIGIGFYGPGGTWDDPDELKNQLYYLNKLENVDGFAIYSFATIKEAYKNKKPLKATQIAPAYKISWQYRCYPAELKSYKTGKLENVKDLSVTKTNDGYELSFTPNDAARSYIIYRSEDGKLLRNNIISITSGEKKNGKIIFNDKVNENSKLVYAVVPISYSNELGEIAYAYSARHKVTFVSEEGKILDIKYSNDGVVEKPDIEIEEGKMLVFSSELNDICSDITIVVKIVDINYKVTYEFLDSEYKSVIIIKDYTYGDEESFPLVYPIKGYEFIGFEKIKDNYWKAKYEKIVYKVEFVDKDNNVIDTQFIAFGDKVTNYPKLAPIEKYEFISWDYTDEITSDIVIKPIYSRKCTIIFKNNLGNVLKTIEAKVGDNISMIDIESVDGYTFEGFYLDGKLITESYITVEKDCEIIVNMVENKNSSCKYLNFSTILFSFSVCLIMIIFKKRRIN